MNCVESESALNNLPKASSRSRIVWLGAISFEDRCVGSLVEIAKREIKLKAVVTVDYATEVWPFVEDSQRRLRNRLAVDDLASKCGGTLERLHVAPYSYQEFRDTTHEKLRQLAPDLLILDVTCLTKIHTLAVAASLSSEESATNWLAAYTMPENYGELNKAQMPFGWNDVIVAPLAETARLFNESNSRGVVVPGHEADRLIVGLAEIEPSGGLILIADNPRRPDIRYISDRNNRKIIRQLTKMRASNWTRRIVRVQDVRKVQEAVDEQVALARTHEAPIILFPYGPKAVILTAALRLCETYRDACWFVYPMPSSYDVDYSEGIDRTLWLSAVDAGTVD